MKLYLTFWFLIIGYFNLHGQTQEQKDSLIDVMCQVIIETKDQPDTVRLFTAYERHLVPFLSQFPIEDINEIENSIFIRFQRNCTDFKTIIGRLVPEKGDWQTIAEKPTSKSNKSLCKNFFNMKIISI